MKPPVDFIPVTDPLMRDPRLDFVVELPVLGIATRFETNSGYVREVVEEAFGLWRGLAPAADTATAEPLRVRLVVFEAEEGVETGAVIRHLCPDPVRVLVHSPGSLAVVDPARREAVAYVSTALAADRAHFRREFLEAVALALITHFDRHPVHAAAIGRDRAVLLAGPSGSGKSTLACLAHAAGLGVLSEDIVWVQLEPRFRLWGKPDRLHLLPETAALFRTLVARGAPVTVNGQRKIAIAIEPGNARFAADDAVVCLLERGAGQPALARLTSEQVQDALGRDPAAGFDRLAHRLPAAIDALSRHGGWRLRLSQDPREALPLLRRMVDGT